MTTYTTMNKATANQIGNEIETVLQKYADEHGLILERRGGKFDDGSFTPKFVFAVPSETGGSKAFADEYKRYLELGCEPYSDCKLEWLGKEFKDGKQTLRFDGFDMAKRKNFVVLTDVNTGANYKASIKYLIQRLGGKK